MRVKWVFDCTKEMSANGTMARRIELDKVRARVLENEEQLKQAILAKVTHPDLAPSRPGNGTGESPEVEALFNDEYIVQSLPVGGGQLCLKNIGAASSMKLELAYQSFVEQLQSMGSDHIEAIALPDGDVLFQVILTKDCVDQNVFQIENQSTLETRQLYRVAEEPSMAARYTKSSWQLVQADACPPLDLSAPEDQAIIARFCSEAQAKS